MTDGNDLQRILGEMEQRRLTKNKAIKAKGGVLDQVFDYLLVWGVHHMEVTFDGGGDDGQIEAITMFSAALREDGTHHTIEFNLPQHIHDMVQTIVYAATDTWDWVNDTGGYGTVRFYCVNTEVWGVHARTVEVDINLREMTSHNYTEMF